MSELWMAVDAFGPSVEIAVTALACFCSALRGLLERP